MQLDLQASRSARRYYAEKIRAASKLMANLATETKRERPPV